MALLLHGGDAQLLARHFVDHIGHGCRGCNHGDLVARVHQVADLGQLLAQLAARVQLREILGAEALAQAYGDGQGVSQGQHGGGRGRRRQIQPAGLALHAAIQGHVTGLGQRRVRIAREADQRVTLALERGQQAQNLLGLARGRQSHHHVARHQYAQIAVQRLGRVQKQGRRTGGTERGGDLLRNNSAFAHAGDHYAAALLTAMQNQLDGAVEGGGHRPFQTRGEGLQGRRLGADQGRRFGGWRVGPPGFTRTGVGLIFFVAHRFLMVTASPP